MGNFKVHFEDGNEKIVDAYDAQQAAETAARGTSCAGDPDMNVTVTSNEDGTKSRFCVQVEMEPNYVATEIEEPFKTLELTRHEYNLTMAAMRVYSYLLDFPRHQPRNTEDCNDLLGLVYNTATEGGTPDPKAYDVFKIYHRLRDI
jgi:hypothetical protein